MKNPNIEPEKIYHFYNHANGFENIFLEQRNFGYFLKKVKQRLEPVLEILAYCLLDNHFHLVARSRAADTIDAYAAQLTSVKGKPFTYPTNVSPDERYNYFVTRQLTNFLISYSRAFNKTYHRRGALFQERMPFKLIDSRGYLRSVIRYVHLNAVHHGIVRGIDLWPHTSLHTFYGHENPLQIPIAEIFAWFGGADAFWEAHRHFRRCHVLGLEPHGIAWSDEVILYP